MMKVLIVLGLLLLVIAALKKGNTINYARCPQSFCIEHTHKLTEKASKKYCKIHHNNPED